MALSVSCGVVLGSPRQISESQLRFDYYCSCSMFDGSWDIFIYLENCSTWTTYSQHQSHFCPSRYARYDILINVKEQSELERRPGGSKDRTEDRRSRWQYRQ